MVLDNDVCGVPGCTLHTGWLRMTTPVRRNEQIREDWRSGSWTLEELSSFWGLERSLVGSIVGVKTSVKT